MKQLIKDYSGVALVYMLVTIFMIFIIVVLG